MINETSILNPVLARAGASLDDVPAILSDRKKTHGDYSEHAGITQQLKGVMYASDGWGNTSYPQRESLEMIQHKIGRILAGDPNFRDHWDDIAGYAMLVARLCG